MGFGWSMYNGHDTHNDDLYAQKDPQADARKKGYLGDSHLSEDESGAEGGLTISSENVNTQGGPSFSPTGEGYDVVNGWKQHDTSAYDKAVGGYRQEGADAQKRAAVQLDQRQADQARGMQMGGLGLMKTAAEGGAPSRAAVLGASANDSTARGALGNLAAGRGPGAAVAGANAAGAGATNKFAQTNAQATDMRGAEMAKNQQEYAKSTGEARGQDISAATQNAQYQAYQNALNEAKQQGKENLGYDTRNFQNQTAMEYERQKQAAANAEAARIAARDAGEDAKTEQNVSTTAALMMMAASDERAKRNIQPVTMGSLSGLTRFMHGRS